MLYRSDTEVGGKKGGTLGTVDTLSDFSPKMRFKSAKPTEKNLDNERKNRRVPRRPTVPKDFVK